MSENKQKYFDQFVANQFAFYLFQKLDPVAGKDEMMAVILSDRYFKKEMLVKILQYMKSEFTEQFKKSWGFNKHNETGY